jgi:Ca-activated chloride channel homolog
VGTALLNIVKVIEIGKSRRLVAAAATALMLLSGAAPPAALGESDQLSYSIAVGYVMIPFGVYDGRGRPVEKLRPRDVKLFVDGQRVRTDMFERSNDAPVSFTILLDGSGSMGLAGKMESAEAAMRALLSRQKPGDEYALYVFASGELRELVPFTTDGTRVISGMRRVQPWGKTAFFDALAQAPEKTRLGNNGSRAIILLTDGIDNASLRTRDDVSRLLEGIEMPIYPLGLRSREQLAITEGEERLDIAVLAAVAAMSGGRLLIAEQRVELERSIAWIDAELRSQYLIGFTPTGRGTVRYRRISLEAGRNRSVRVRAGYRGTAPPLLSDNRSNSQTTSR